MHPFLIAVMAVTSILFVWGLLSPRSQWQLLVGWTRSNPRESEPGGGAYGVARLLSLVGILGVIAIVAAWAVPRMERPLITVSPPQALVERLWGVPAPVVADRVITPLGSAPDGLVSQRLSGYQLVDSTARTPGYLFTLTAVRGEGLGSEQGFLGGVPAPGTTALDGADFVVGVRVDILCIPQQLVVTQSTTAVQVGVFVGQPGAVGGIDASNASTCDAVPSLVRTTSYLVPVNLGAPLGGRVLQGLDGQPIAAIAVPAE